MDLHRLRVVGFDTSVSKKEDEKKFIAELEKCEEHYKTSSDEQNNETGNDNKQSLDDKIGPPGPSKKCLNNKVSTLEPVEEYPGDTSSPQGTSVKLCMNDEITPTETSQICLDNKTSPPGTSKKLRFTKSKSNNELLKILPKKKPRIRDLKINTSDVDLTKLSQKSTHSHQKKRPFTLLNRNSRIQQKVDNVKEKKAKDEEVHCLFARETPSFIRSCRNRAVNERVRAKKKRDSKLTNDVYGFQSYNRSMDPYLYQMSCLNFIDTDKFLSKKFRVGFHRKVKPRPPQPVTNKFCKYHAMRVLNYACENGESPSIYYNLDTHPHLPSDYDQEDGLKKVRLRYTAKDETVEVSPSSLSPVSISFRDAGTGPSKVELNTNDNQTPTNCEKKKCDECMSPEIQKPNPQPDTTNPCAACGAPAQNTPNPSAACATPAHNIPNPCATCATPAHNIPNPCATCATPAQNKPNPYAACASPAQNIPKPCAASTTPTQNKPHEVTLTSSLKKDKKTKNIFFVVNNARKSFISRFFQHVTDFHTNKKHSGKSCVKYVLFGLLIVVWSPCLLAVILAWVVMCPGRITNIIKTDTSKRSFPKMNHSLMNRFRKKDSLSEYQQMCFENYMPKKKRSFMTSVASWYSRTFGNSFNAVISLFKLKKKSPTCCGGSSSLPTTHPNPRKRYTLFYADNRGWVMKPSRHRTTRSCASSRVVQNMRCEFKSKFWPVKSKSEKKPQKKTLKRVLCPVHGVNSYPRHQFSPAGDAYPYETPRHGGCNCWDKYSQFPAVCNVVKSRRRPRQQVNIPSTFFYSTSGNASDSANETVKTKVIHFDSKKIADNIVHKTVVRDHINRRKNGTLPYGVVYNYPCRPKNPLSTNVQMYKSQNCKHKFDLAGKTLTMSSKYTPGLLLKSLQRQFPKRWTKHQAGNTVKKSLDVNKYPGFTDMIKSMPSKSTPICKLNGLRGQTTKRKIAANCLSGKNHKSGITNNELNSLKKNLYYRNNYGLADISTSILTKQGVTRTHKMNNAHKTQNTSKHIAHQKVTNTFYKTKKGKLDITASKYTFEAKKHLHKQSCKHKLNKIPVSTQYKPRTVNIKTNTNRDKASNFHSEKKHKHSKQIYRYKPDKTQKLSTTVDNTTHTHRDIALNCPCDDKSKQSKQGYKYKPDQIPVAIQKQPSTVDTMTNTNHDKALNYPSVEKHEQSKQSYKYKPDKTPKENQKQSSTVDNSTRTHRDIALNCPCEEKYKQSKQGYKYKAYQIPVATQMQISKADIMTNTNHDKALNCPSEEKHEESKQSFNYKPDKTPKENQKQSSTVDNTTRTHRDIALNCPCEEKYKYTPDQIPVAIQNKPSIADIMTNTNRDIALNYPPGEKNEQSNQEYKYKPDQIPITTENQPNKANIMTNTDRNTALNCPCGEKHEQSKQVYKYKPHTFPVATQKKPSTVDIMTNTNRDTALNYPPGEKHEQIPIETQNQPNKTNIMTSTNHDIALNCPCGGKHKQSIQEYKNKPDQIPVGTQKQPSTANIMIGSSRDIVLNYPSGEKLEQSKQGFKYKSDKISVATQKRSNLADDTTSMGHNSAFNYYGVARPSTANKDLLSILSTADEDTICIKKTSLPESLPKKQDIFIQKQSSKIDASVNCGREYARSKTKEMVCQKAYSLRQKAPLVGKTFEMRFSVAQPLTTRKFQTEELILNPRPNSPLLGKVSDSHCDVMSPQNKPNNETKQISSDSTNTHSHKITSGKQPHTQQPNLTQAQFDTLREQAQTFSTASVCTCETNQPLVTEKTLKIKESGSKFNSTQGSPQSSKINSVKTDNTLTIFTLSSERLPTKIARVNSSQLRIAPDCRCHVTHEQNKPDNQTAQIRTNRKNTHRHKISIPKELPNQRENLTQAQSHASGKQLESLSKAKSQLIRAQKSLSNKIMGSKLDGTQKSPYSKRNSVKTNNTRPILSQSSEQNEYDKLGNEANQIVTDSKNSRSHKTSIRKEPPSQQPNLTQSRRQTLRKQSQSFCIAPDCTCGIDQPIVAEKNLNNKVTGSKLYGTQRSPHPSKRKSVKTNNTRPILPQSPEQNEYDKPDNEANQITTDSKNTHSHKTSIRNEPLSQQPNLTQARLHSLSERSQSFGIAPDCTCGTNQLTIAEKSLSNKVTGPKLDGTQRSLHPSKRNSVKTNNTRPILPQSPEQNENDKPDNEANQIVTDSKNAHSHKTIMLRQPSSQQPKTQSRPRTLQEQSQPFGVPPSKIPQGNCPLLRKSPDCRCGLIPNQNKSDSQTAQIVTDSKNKHSHKIAIPIEPPSQRTNLTEAQNQFKSSSRAKNQSVVPYKAEKMHLSTNGHNINPHSFQSQRLRYPSASPATRKTTLETNGQRKFSQRLPSAPPDNPKVDSLHRLSQSKQSERPIEKQFDTNSQQPKAKQTIPIIPGSCKCAGVHQFKTKQSSNNKVEPNTGLQKFQSDGFRSSDKARSDFSKSPEHQFEPSLVKILQESVDKGTSQESPKSAFWDKYKALLKIFCRAKTQQHECLCNFVKTKESNIPVPQNTIRQPSIQSLTGTNYGRFVCKSSSQLRSSSRVSQYSSKVSSLIRSLSSKLFSRKISQQTKIPKNLTKKPRSVVFSSSREYFTESTKVNKSHKGLLRHGQPLKSSLRSTLSSRLSLTSCLCPVHETKTSLHTPKPMLDEESNATLPLHSSHSMFNNRCSCQIYKRYTRQCAENSRYIREPLPVDTSYSCLSSIISKTPSLPSQSSKLGCRCHADNTLSAYHMHPTFSTSIINQKCRTSQDSSIVMSKVPIVCKCSCDETFLTQKNENSHQILKKSFKRKSPTKLQHLLSQPNRSSQFSASLNRSREILSAYSILTNNQRPSKKHDSHILSEKQTVLTQCLSLNNYQLTPTANQTMPSQYLGDPIIPIIPGMCKCAAKHFGKTTIKNDVQSKKISPLENKQEKTSTLHVLTALIIPNKTGYLPEKLHQPSNKMTQNSRKSILTKKIPPSILPPYLLSTQPIQLSKDSRKTRVGTEAPAEHGNEQKVSKSLHKNADNQCSEKSYYHSGDFQKLHLFLRDRSAKKKRLARENISNNAHTTGHDKKLFGKKHIIVQRLQTPKSPRFQIYQEIQPNPQIQANPQIQPNPQIHPDQQNLQIATKDKPPPELLQRYSTGQGLKGRTEGGVQQPYPDFDRVSMRYPGHNSPRRQSRQMSVINRPERIHPLTVNHYKAAPGATPPQNYTVGPCYANPANRCAKQSPYDECALRRAYERRPLRYVPPRQQVPKAVLIKKLKESRKKKSIKLKHEKLQVANPTNTCTFRESLIEIEKEAWPNDVTCRPMYINILKKKPGFWIYERWPSLYPAFLNFYKFIRALGQMLIYLFTLCFWSPCLLCGYLCFDLCCYS